MQNIKSLIFGSFLMLNLTASELEKSSWDKNAKRFEDILFSHSDSIERSPGSRACTLNEILLRRRITWRTDLIATQIMVKLLVNHGANLESPCMYHRNPYGVKNYQYARADDDNGCSDEYIGTPLILATEACDYDLVVFFVSKGANVNAKDRDGRNALELARVRHHYNPEGYDKIINFLESYLISRRENRALQQCLMPKDIHSLMTEYTLASQSTRNPELDRRHPYIAKPEGSELIARAQHNALYTIKQGLKNNDLVPLENFIEAHPKSINIQDEAGNSLLLLAIKVNNVIAVRLILLALEEMGALEGEINERLMRAINVKNIYNETAFDAASTLNNQEIIDILRPYYNAPEIILR